MDTDNSKKTIVGYVQNGASMCLKGAIDASAEAAEALRISQGLRALCERMFAASERNGDDLLRIEACKRARVAYSASKVAEEKRKYADKLQASGQVMTGLATYIALKDFSTRTAELNDASSALSVNVAELKSKIGELGSAVESAGTIVQISNILDQLVQISAGLANKL